MTNDRIRAGRKEGGTNDRIRIGRNGGVKNDRIRTGEKKEGQMTE